MTTAEEIAFLEERKAELLRLKKLRDEVAALERESLKIAAESAAVLRLIVLKVSEHWHTEPHRLINFDRHEPMAVPRHVARYLARELTRLSFPELAAYFGRKNHATVIYSVRYVWNRIDTDEDFREQIKALKVEIADEIQMRSVPKSRMQSAPVLVQLNARL